MLFHHYLKYLAGEPEIVTVTNELVREIRRLVDAKEAGKYQFKNVDSPKGKGADQKSKQA
ncbi:hypothetical protein HSBAA_18390 [Vreelandella sulfidaeris]|uniref:Uncharacterized protein n=1 Tax=Vreelandella sulfidaeris TaxID=115553 RepID=A0A455U5P9_9GAMM|nr:hypothetical protein HSBAA_18390 [Halomonas sulfidaeris]